MFDAFFFRFVSSLFRFVSFRFVRLCFIFIFIFSIFLVLWTGNRPLNSEQYRYHVRPMALFTFVLPIFSNCVERRSEYLKIGFVFDDSILVLVSLRLTFRLYLAVSVCLSVCSYL